MIKAEKYAVEKIKRNPFRFQKPLKRANDSLQRNIRFLHEFFELEITAPKELYDAWNKFQERYGDTAIFQFTESLRTVRNLKTSLLPRDQREEKDRAETVSGVLVLLHIGLLEFVEAGEYRAFPDWLLGRLKREKGPLPEHVDLKSFRKYLLRLKGDYETSHGAARSVIRALQAGLDGTEKTDLCMGFQFTKPYDLGSNCSEFRHLHCWTRLQRNRSVRPFCTSICKPPSTAERDPAIAELARKLYNMRSAYVHRSTATRFMTPDKTYDGWEYNGFTNDVYFDKSGKLISYTVSLRQEHLLRLFRSCLWNRIHALSKNVKESKQT